MTAGQTANIQGFKVTLAQVRESVGVSVGESAENARAALMAHRAGFSEVTIQDPRRTKSVTFRVGGIKVTRAGTGVDSVNVSVSHRATVTSGHRTSVTSGHRTSVTSGHRTSVTSGHRTSVTSGSTVKLSGGKLSSYGMEFRR